MVRGVTVHEFIARGAAIVCVLAALCGLLVPTPGRTQDGAEDPLAELQWLVGVWSGDIDGALGTGRGTRSYELAVQGKYLLSQHVSRRPPQEKSPGGDQHEEIGMFSYDRARGTIVYRQFVNEGFVVRYTCRSLEGGGFECEAEEVESGPSMQARWTVTRDSANVFTETFELAAPGKPLRPLFTNRWTRLR